MIKALSRFSLAALLVIASGATNAAVDPVQPDAQTGQNFNRYAYGNNNPYRFTDPDGRQVREVNFETSRSGYQPPPRSPDDWLGPAIGAGLTGMMAAPAIGFVGTTSLGSAALRGAAEIGMGDALGGASLAGGGAAVFRVVDSTELRSIQDAGRFLQSPNGDSVKRFVGSLSDAQSLSAEFTRFFREPQFIVQGNASRAAMDAVHRTPLSDVPGAAIQSINVPVSHLPFIQYQNRVDVD